MRCAFLLSTINDVARAELVDVPLGIEVTTDFDEDQDCWGMLSGPWSPTSVLEGPQEVEVTMMLGLSPSIRWLRHLPAGQKTLSATL